MKTIPFPTALRLALGLVLTLTLASPPAAASNGTGQGTATAATRPALVHSPSPVGTRDHTGRDHAPPPVLLAWDRVGSPLPPFSFFS